MWSRLLDAVWPSRNPVVRAERQFRAIPLGPGDIAIDCGANVGEITDHLARAGATVYAFEPNPFAFEALTRRFAGRANVHCLPRAVSHAAGTARLYFHEHSGQDEVQWSTGSSLLDFKGNVLKDKFVDVDTVDLAAFITSLGARVKVLKIDVEGVEVPIVRALIDTGAIDQVDHVFVETHEHKIPELRADTDALRALIRERGITHINLDWT